MEFWFKYNVRKVVFMFGLTDNNSNINSFSKFHYDNLKTPVIKAKPQVKTHGNQMKDKIVWAISLLTAITTVFVLAKKGMFGNKIKTFINNLLPKKLSQKTKISNPNLPFSHVIEKSNISANTNSVLSIAERKKVLEKLKKMPGVNIRHLTINEDGKIHPLFLQNLDFAKEKMYDSIRCANYQQIGDKTIAECTGASTSTIKVSHNMQAGTWDYRSPISLIEKGNAKERISLNVRPDKKLIEKLDKYLSDNVKELQGYYKTPGYYEGWSLRHDPITIYFRKSVNDKVLENIAQIAEPYARENGNSVLIGKRFGTCCSHMREPEISDYEFLKKRFLKIFGKENTRLDLNPYGIRIGPNPHLSAGEFWAYNEVFNRITGKNIQVLIP